MEIGQLTLLLVSFHSSDVVGLKRSGMRWRQAGGQAILTFRSWCQSDRFERAWALLAATCKRPV